MSVFSALQQSRLIHQVTSLDALKAREAQGPLSAYVGFDLTADSLHVGSLIPIVMARRLIAAGHSVVILLGTATTMVGDPTGRDTSRPMLSPEEIATNRAGIIEVLGRLVPGASFVNNLATFTSMSALDYMRDFGPHFTINRLLTFDSVKTRLERQEPMTFLEFNYILMQAIDFLELARGDRACDLQFGGSDQWGNIVNGVELTRRVTGREVFGLTTPLLTDAQGRKMGKTAGGETIWLSANKTSVFDFWQFWRNVPDSKVSEFFAFFAGGTDFEAEHPEADVNVAKGILADVVTTLVHGDDAAKSARQQAERIFLQGDDSAAPLHRVKFALDDPTATVAEVLIRVGAVKSRGEADRLAQQGGVTLNSERLDDVRRNLIGLADFTLGVGKKKRFRIALSWDI